MLKKQHNGKQHKKQKQVTKKPSRHNLLSRVPKSSLRSITTTATSQSKYKVNPTVGFNQTNISSLNNNNNGTNNNISHTQLFETKLSSPLASLTSVFTRQYAYISSNTNVNNSKITKNRPLTNTSSYFSNPNLSLAPASFSQSLFSTKLPQKEQLQLQRLQKALLSSNAATATVSTVNNNNTSVDAEIDEKKIKLLSFAGLKHTLKKYGKTFVITFLGVYAAWIGAVGAAVWSSPFDPMALVTYAKDTHAFDSVIDFANEQIAKFPQIQQYIDNNQSFCANLAASYVILQLTDPVRMIVTLALTKKVHERLEKAKALMNPQQSAPKPYIQQEGEDVPTVDDFNTNLDKTEINQALSQEEGQQTPLRSKRFSAATIAKESTHAQ